jgi:hypothetical protein
VIVIVSKPTVPDVPIVQSLRSVQIVEATSNKQLATVRTPSFRSEPILPLSAKRISNAHILLHMQAAFGQMRYRARPGSRRALVPGRTKGKLLISQPFLSKLQATGFLIVNQRQPQ